MDTSAEVLTDNRRAQDEFTLQLVNALTPSVLQGLTSILVHAEKLCAEQGEEEKYLMMFQNMLARIPGWSSSTISEEVERITETSQIGYLADLVTAVHIIHLRILSLVRVGHKPKRIEIDPPDFDQFVHRVYCEAGRKMWIYAYLFQRDVPDLEQQRNMHECEKIVQDCVISAVRSSMPVETILRAYIDEAEEIRLSAIEEAKEAKEAEAAENGDADQSANAHPVDAADVGSEIKRIVATDLPSVDDEADDVDGYPTLKLDVGGMALEDTAPPSPSPSPGPDNSLNVGFADKNEVLDMGTNRTAAVPMSPGSRSPAPLPGPPLEEVTLDNLIDSTAISRPLSSGSAPWLPPPAARAQLPVMRLDTSPLG